MVIPLHPTLSSVTHKFMGSNMTVRYLLKMLLTCIFKRCKEPTRRSFGFATDVRNDSDGTICNFRFNGAAGWFGGRGVPGHRRTSAATRIRSGRVHRWWRRRWHNQIIR